MQDSRLDLFDAYELKTEQLARMIRRGESFTEIANTLPYAMHVNDSRTVELLGVNTAYNEYMGADLEEVQQGGLAYLSERMHPESLANIPRFIAGFHRLSGPTNVLPYLQYVKLYRQVDYSPILTFSTPIRFKQFNEEKRAMLCLSIKRDQLGHAAEKLDKIVEIDQFKLRNFARFKQITSRQREILCLICAGWGNAAIADRLCLSRQTVETHRKQIKAKLEAKSIAELMRFAIAFDLINV